MRRLAAVWLFLWENCGAIVVGIVIASMCACATSGPPASVQTAQPAPIDSVVPIRAIGVDSAFRQHFALIRESFKDEAVQCLYGVLTGDTAIVAFMRPAYTFTSTPTIAYYQSCPEPRIGMFGPLRYLGTIHAHVGGADCDFSILDTRSFFEDKRSLLELLSCSTGLISRVK